jgi:cell division protein FtsL
MRLLNIMVIAALIIAASAVYKIKFDSTLQAEKVDKLRGELRHERNAIAALRAEWARLDTPSRIQALAERFLPNLQPEKATQFGNFADLPPRPPALPPAPDGAAGAMLAPANPETTGSLPASKPR